VFYSQVDIFIQTPKASRNCSSTRVWARASAVAMKIVSSPDTVPATSPSRLVDGGGHAAGRTDRGLDHGDRRAGGAHLAHELRDGAKLVLGSRRQLRGVGQHVPVAVLEHAELAQVAADRGLRDRMALALQQAHEFLLAAHRGARSRRTMAVRRASR
jgi:hypothetical protein